MRNLVVFIIMICIMLLLSTSCTRRPNEKIKEDNNKYIEDDITRKEEIENNEIHLNDEVNEDDSKLSKEYVNSKYRFSIYLPENWRVEQYSNENGAKIIPNEGREIIEVYGKLYDKSGNSPYANGDKNGFSKRKVITAEGEEATIIEGEENGNYIYELVIIKDKLEYHIYANMSKDFYYTNRELIDDMVKSLDITPGQTVVD